MDKKSILANFVELAIYCQAKRKKEVLSQFENTPKTPESKKFIEGFLEEHEYLMTDCNAILEAEQLYLKTKLT